MKPISLSIKNILLLALAIGGYFLFIHPVKADYNLLTNPGAERFDLSGWNLTNSGDNGFWIDGETAYVHSGVFSFISSYEWDTMSQEIDLLAKGYSTTSLDSQPPINISTFETGHWPNPNDLYDVKVQLRDASHSVVASFDTGQQTSAGDHVWTQIAHTFTSYGTGVRYIYFEQDGHDAEFWAGNYGAVFDDASVTIGGAGPSLSITSPQNGQTVNSWSPIINWGNSASCQYSYDNLNYTAVNCGNNGSDIPEATTTINPTLFILGLDASGNSTIATSTFTLKETNSLTYDLAGYWKLDETATGTCAGGKDACDSSGSGNNGTYAGSPTASSTVPSVHFADPESLSFNGSTDYIQVNRPVADNFSICAWIKTATPGSGLNHWQTAPILDAEVPGLASDFGFGINSNGVLAYGNGGYYDSTVTGTSTVTDNLWHYACATRDQTAGVDTLYVDGRFDASGTTDTLSLNSSSVARIGYGLDGNSAQHFNGLIDDIRVYSRVLLPSEISILASGYDKIDHIPPVITLTGNPSVSVDYGSSYTDPGATAADDVDGDITSRIVVTGSVNTSAAGSYTITYNVFDSSGNAAVPVTRTITVAELQGGGGLPPVAYVPPEAPVSGFNIVANQGAGTAGSPKLTITSNAGADVKYIALSTSPDFADTGLIPYEPTVTWDLCGVGISCPNGRYIIYAKFYTSWGQQSSVVSTAVDLKQNPLNSQPVNLVTAMTASTGQIKTVANLSQVTQNLKRGSRGSQVSLLQSLLARDPAVYPDAQVTGYFGPLTQLAVEKFQIKYSIVTTGSPGFGTVGPLTRAKLNEL